MTKKKVEIETQRNAKKVKPNNRRGIMRRKPSRQAPVNQWGPEYKELCRRVVEMRQMDQWLSVMQLFMAGEDYLMELDKEDPFRAARLSRLKEVFIKSMDISYRSLCRPPITKELLDRSKKIFAALDGKHPAEVVTHKPAAKSNAAKVRRAPD
jgi:hypothetical protein